MDIVSKTLSTTDVIVGRLSDGSDREIINVPAFTVKIKDSFRTLQMVFDHDPVEAEILEKLSEKDYIDITEEKDIIDSLQQQINDISIAMAAILGGAV